MFWREHFKGQSHGIDLALIDMTRSSRPEKCSESGFELFILLYCFLFNEIVVVCFPLAGGFSNVLPQQAYTYLTNGSLLQPALHTA